jgi:mannose-6-phosphate isomerase
VREGFAPLLQALESDDTASALRNFLSALFGLPSEVRQALTEYMLSADPPIPADSAAGDPRSLIPDFELMQDFATQYPGDPAVIAPLYLNVFQLEPGEAVFLEAGVLHAYIHGFGIELMANSDNVLRGGANLQTCRCRRTDEGLGLQPILSAYNKTGRGFQFYLSYFL